MAIEVRRDCDVAFLCEPACDVLDMWHQAKDFLDHDYAGIRPAAIRMREIGGDATARTRVGNTLLGHVLLLRFLLRVDYDTAARVESRLAARATPTRGASGLGRRSRHLR